MDSDVVREFQHSLVRLRDEQGYSQAAFARAVGVSARMMCHYEKESENLPPGAILVKMAETLGCSIDAMLNAELGKADGRTVEGRVLRRFKDAARLPESDRMLLVQMLDALLAKNELEPAVSG